jgi:hypothetical protein
MIKKNFFFFLVDTILQNSKKNKITCKSPVTPIAECNDKPLDHCEEATFTCNRFVLGVPKNEYRNGRAIPCTVDESFVYHIDCGPLCDHSTRSNTP